MRKRKRESQKKWMWKENRLREQDNKEEAINKQRKGRGSERKGKNEER
jgi:hypothetical protein